MLGPPGDPWLTLRPHAAFDTTDGVDETLSVSPPRVTHGQIEIERRSSLWDRARVTIECTDSQLVLRSSVSGRGALADVNLLAIRSLLPNRPSGLLPSGYAVGRVTKLFCANPAHPTGVRPVHEPAVIGVTGDGEPGWHHWFFTPAPLYFAWAEEDEGKWLDLGLAYEGHTAVEGEFEAPALVLTPGVLDPSTGLRRHRDDLAALGAAPAVEARERPSWWTEPIFCGWGAQFHLSETGGGSPMEHATEVNYDRFLETLEREELRPGIVVLDDKCR